MIHLGVDLGGTKIAVGITDDTGHILYKDNVPTCRERGYAAIIKDIIDLCKEIINKQQIDIKDIKSIGIGSPGRCDSGNGTIIYANNFDFENTSIKDEIQKHINLPVYVENDGNCAALAENMFGAAKGAKNSITITLGTGVGSGVILNGRIFCGSFFGGCELGHQVIRKDGELCTCGRKGCWEAYASASALIREAKIAAVRNPHSLINSCVKGDLSRIEAKTVFDCADQGDQTAKIVVNEYLLNIAEGIANLINIFEPEVIVIGGGVSAQGEKLLAPVNEIITSLTYGGKSKTRLAIAQLGNDAGIIGAAFLD